MPTLNNSHFAIAQNFEVLLKYAAAEKVLLTPKQKFIPVKHAKNMMENFRVKEPHEENEKRGHTYFHSEAIGLGGNRT